MTRSALLALTILAIVLPRDVEAAPPIAAFVEPGSSNASQYQRDRAVKTFDCTATRIATQWAISAIHCKIDVGETVYFYDGGPGRGSRGAKVVEVVRRPGTSSSDFEDNNGDLSDMVLLRLQSTASSNTSENAMLGPSAVLAWKYPGDGANGKKIGAGSHEGKMNPMGELRQIGDETDDDDDSGGYFVTAHEQLDPGDSGGPFYVDARVVGILKKQDWDPGDGNFNMYTSVPYHLDWILGKIGYRWRGLTPQAGTKYSGKVIDTVYGSEKRCQYASEMTASCEAYNWKTSTHACDLIDDVTTASSASSTHGALRHGASSGLSNEVVGYVRGDGFNSVVHATADGTVRELYLQNGWKHAVLVGNAPPAAGKLSAYVRGDGINSIVYRSTGGRIIELALVGGQWKSFDLSNVGGGTPAGDPVGYVRADGLSAVVYRGTDGKIHELRLASRGWRAAVLTDEADSNVVATSDPHAFRRSDGYSSVVFRGGDHIFELYTKAGSAWKIGNLSTLATNGEAPAAASRPFGFTHVDGFNGIIYRSTTGRVIELWLAGSGWRWGELDDNLPRTTFDPMAYVRADATEAVIIRASSHKVLEIANTPWKPRNLSDSAGYDYSSGSPSASVRTDGYNSVYFESANHHVHELHWRPGQSKWAIGDISALAGE
jgi:hypothetical protein